MKTLYLVRHAKSSWADGSLADIDRPLNARGIESCARLGPYLAAHGVIPDLVLCSPARRTRETIERLAEHLERPLKTQIDRSLYLGSPSAILRAIRHADETARSLMVVGHNPALGLIARSFKRAGVAPELERLAASKFPTAAFAHYEADIETWKGFGPEVARLVTYLTPKLLAR